MVATKEEAYSMIESMSDVDFSELKVFFKYYIRKGKEKTQCWTKFVSDVKEAEESVKNGNYVTLKELHEFLES